MIRITILFLVMFIIPLSGICKEEIVTIDTRNNIKLDILVCTTDKPNGTALILFPGGDGSNEFEQEDGVITKGDNFLVRSTSLFTTRGFWTVVVGMPSDSADGMNDDFRSSAAHLQDITKVVDYIVKKGYSSIYLVGTSRGTISVAFLGSSLKHPAIKGIVLTSAMAYTRFLRWIPLEETPYPVLIVHHMDDACKTTPYNEAKQLVGRFKKSPNVHFEGVAGGLPPESKPCKALSAHGFLGIEERVVDIIAAWILISDNSK